MRWPYTEKENEKEAKFRALHSDTAVLHPKPFQLLLLLSVQITFPERLNNSSQLIITLIRHGLKSTKKKSHKICTPFDNFVSKTTRG
jgi:hypothetical protein